jgi:RNA polymerase sigma-70 factor, ECF subfamily
LRGAVVSTSNRSVLQGVLTADYDGLLRRLTRKFGCADFASETLHETFERLDSVSEATVVRSPKDYLFQTAVNVGRNRRKAERRRATAAEVDALLDVADEVPDAERIVGARKEIVDLVPILNELPVRRRKAFKAALLHNRPYRDIAQELGVSLRTVELEVQQAIEHCAHRLGRDVTRRASGRRRRA